MVFELFDFENNAAPLIYDLFHTGILHFFLKILKKLKSNKMHFNTNLDYHQLNSQLYNRFFI